MDLLTSNALLRSYFLLPHRLLNQGFARLVTRSRPRWLVQAAIRAWTHRAGLDLRDFESGPFETVQAFFLRRLKPGARPLGPGFVSPVDGFLVAAGPIGADTVLPIKRQALSLDRVVNGPAADGPPRFDLKPYVGGRYAVIFLTPQGYHHLHMPSDGEIVAWRWIPGRFFPQNQRALSRIRGVYERNERASLRIRLSAEPSAGSSSGLGAGPEILMTLVGASLVGGIHVEGLDLEALQAGPPRLAGGSCRLARRKGEELGHFRFGSTIVLLLPPGFPGLEAPGAPGALDAPQALQHRPVGSALRLGETLWPLPATPTVR